MIGLIYGHSCCLSIQTDNNLLWSQFYLPHFEVGKPRFMSNVPTMRLELRFKLRRFKLSSLPELRFKPRAVWLQSTCPSLQTYASPHSVMYSHMHSYIEWSTNVSIYCTQLCSRCWENDRWLKHSLALKTAFNLVEGTDRLGSNQTLVLEIL